MDIAVLSDIHGNHVALQACFDYCVSRGIRTFLLLGDYISDCPSPQKTMKLLYVIRDYFNGIIIRGSREETMLSYRKGGEKGWSYGSAQGAYLYTYENLTKKDLDFFESLPIYGMWQGKYEIKGYEKFEYCHGSPAAAAEILLKEKRNTKRVLSKLKTNILIHGHHHEQEAYTYRGKRSINPGSVGLPWGYGGKAQFCILHGDRSGWKEENIRLSYDTEPILREFAESGLTERAPAWAAVTMHTIRTGVDLSEIVLLLAMRLCQKELGQCGRQGIPEKYFAEALRRLKIDLQGRDIP